MNTRESKSEDLGSIYRVHEDAFGKAEGKLIAQLAYDILVDEPAQPLRSLAAEENGRMIGSIMFSSGEIVAHTECSAYILAPLAVLTACHHKGVGTKLRP